MRPRLPLCPVAALAALGLAATPLAAQQLPSAPPGAHDPAKIKAGSYQIDPDHTQVRFGVLHLGFNPYYGVFSGASGSLTIDPAHPERATVDVSVPVASVMTTSSKLDEELRSSAWLDAQHFPTIRFVADHVLVNGTTARVWGKLTLHGVTRPIMLEVAFVGAGIMPMGGGPTVGFTARGVLRRSDFGVTAGLPLVSDEVTIGITCAFEQGQVTAAR